MEERKSITVTRTASAKLPANFVEISVSAVSEADSYAKAVAAADALSDGVVGELKAAGIAVRASGVNVSVLRDGKKISGYRAMRMFGAEFEYDKDVLSKALDALAKSKCEWRVSFALKNSDMASTLIARAVADAKKSAEVIAEAADVKLGALVKADYASDDGGGRMFVRAAAYCAADDAEPEEITLSETVTCSWKIE